jgi:cytochrome c553
MTANVRRAAPVVLLLSIAGAQQWHGAVAFGGDDAVTLPARLSGTGLFASGGSLEVAAANRPFAPQYPLWTDGATKRRWVHLPAGSTIDASNPRHWEFPVGTRLWKEFSFAGRRVETRLLWKATPREWIGGSYVWTADQTDAMLVADDGLPAAMEIAPGRQHNIPSRVDCAACHGEARQPLGFNPLQLSDDRDPNALHGEPLAPGMVTLNTLLDEGRLTGASASLRTTPPRIAARDPQTRAVLGYLSANCGACHNGDGQITAQLPSFHYADVIDGEATARQLIGQPARWQAPGRTEGTLLIDSASPAASAVLLRMGSRRPSTQMPPLGTVLRDQQAIDAIGQWIVAVTREQ